MGTVKNIAYIIDPVNLSTGAYKSTIRTMNLLPRNKYKIIVIADSSPASIQADFPKDAKVYRTRSLPLFFDRNQWLAIPTEKELQEIFEKEKIDIVHTIMPTIASLKSIKIAKRMGKKVVSHSHTQPENFSPYIPGVLAHASRFLLYKYLAHFYKKADRVICVSKFGQDLLMNQYDASNTQVISNGVDTEKFCLNGVVPRFNKILYVGRLDPEKDIPTLIRAIKVLENSDVYLNIVGKGGQENKIRRLVKNLNLENRVALLGRISENKLIKEYQSADIFVLPSAAELEGMVVLEAMACGKPIIIANSPDSASRFFVEGNGYLFQPRDYSDLAYKIKSIIENPKLQKEMSEKSRKISKKYDIRTSIKKLQEIYDSL